MEIRKDLAFPAEEYLTRLGAIRSRMAGLELDALLVTGPENICYLAGYQTPGYYFPQTLVVTHDRDPQIVIRKFEGGNVDAFSWLDSSNLRTFEDNEAPMRQVAQTLHDLGVAERRIGVDFKSWFHTVRNHQELVSLLNEATIVDASGLVEAERAIKSGRELDYIRKAGRISSLAAGAAAEHLSRGNCTENELAARVHESVVGNGGEYPGLPVFVSSGHRTMIPHAVWSGKAIESGESVFLEVTGVVRRYAAPIFRTYHVGKPTKGFLDRARIVRDMLDATIDAIGPGVTSDSVNEAAMRVARRLGGGVTKRAGYSVGLNFPPDWGEGVFLDLKAGDETVLEPGMAFHIPQTLRLKGEAPVAISETVIVTERGRSVVTDYPRDLIVIDQLSGQSAHGDHAARARR